MSEKSQNLWLDFKEIKEKVGMEDLVRHYGLLEKLKRKNDQLTGFCPLPGHTGKGKKSPSFSVSTAKNAWKCFSCNIGGNIFDFVMAMENLSEVREAAEKISAWFNGVGIKEKPAQDTGTPAEPTTKPEKTAVDEPKTTTTGTETEEPKSNPPLTFTLKNLEPKHPYLKKRKLQPETIEHFGVGFCSKGLMKDRIVIPIHNQNGELVAYAGRAITANDEKEGKYKFPPKFQKSLVIFNLHRALAESDGQSLILVEGFFDVMWLWQCGYKNAAALMGSSMSQEQEDLLTKTLQPQGRLTIFFDGDTAGQSCTKEVLNRLAPAIFVKVFLPKWGQEPDGFNPTELQAILGTTYLSPDYPAEQRATLKQSIENTRP